MSQPWITWPTPIWQLKGAESLDAFDFSDKGLGPASAVAIAKCIAGNTVLRSLNLSGNDLGEAGLAALADCLRVNARLKKLNLDGFALPIRQLKGTEPVDELNLSSKRLGVASARIIAKCIAINPVLTTLDLFGNKIGAEGANALTSALEANLTLKRLDLRVNLCVHAPQAPRDIISTLLHTLAHCRLCDLFSLGGSGIDDAAKGKLRELARTGLKLEL